MKKPIDTSNDYELKLNEKQGLLIDWLLNHAPMGTKKFVGVLGGRGGGKSAAMVVTFWLIMNFLPKSKGQFAFTAVSKFKRAISPSLKANLSAFFGLKPYDFKTKKGDYVMYREPPAHWDRPYEEPDDWSNCISFPNGCVGEVCGYSQDPDAMRGRNDDWAIIEEALKFKEEWLAVLYPCIRANIGKFDHRLHWTTAYFSTPPYGSSGYWVYNYEKEAKTDLSYFFTFIKTIDNQAFLPPDYISSLKKTLLRIQFLVEVLGHRISRPEKEFYPAFNREKHAPDTESDEFYSEFLPIVLSIDFNAHFTSCSVWQNPQKNLHHNTHALFVKEPAETFNISQTLAIEFAKDFKDHPNKKITITGDRNGANKSASVRFVDGKWLTPFVEFGDVLESYGWNVTSAPIDVNPLGFEKYKSMHDVFAEQMEDPIIFRFEPTHALPTIISIENTPINPDYSKNKKSETDGSAQELATHLSDTVDYYAEFVRLGGNSFSSHSFELL